MKKEKKAKKQTAGAEGTSLFPMPSTPLGKACEKFVDTTEDIARKKLARDEVKLAILAEMKKEKRQTLTVTVGNDNWRFDIKEAEEDLRCVKVTRQPQTKTVSVDEE